MGTTIQQPQVASSYRERWKKWILFRLGAPMVKVELTNAALDIAIDEAVQRFSQWSMESERITFFKTIPEQSTYSLPDLLPDYIGVRSVVYTPYESEDLITDWLGGSLPGYSTLGYGIGYQYFNGTMMGMTDIVINNLYNEMFRRVTGREGQYKIVGTQLMLAPVPKTSVNVMIHYSSMMLDQDVRRDEWIKEWALTEAQMSLGQIRSKYQSLPGPGGDSLSLNGEALLQRAAEQQERLLERLNEFREPYLMDVG